MGFDFVNSRMSGVTGPVTITSGSVAYPALNADLTASTPQINANGIAITTGYLIVRNGLIINAIGISSSTQPF
jgi:hypothetical protein